MNLPHRFSEKSFRRYEPIIAAIVREFPRATVVQPNDLRLSAETVRGRLRDAVTSLHHHRWTTDISLTRFDEIYDSLVISLRPDGTVIAGDKASVKGEVFSSFTAIDPTDIIDCTGEDRRFDISALCFLAHNHALSKRLKVKLHAESVDFWSNQYDIVLTPYENGTYLLS